MLCIKNSWSCANTGSIRSFFLQHIPTCLCLISSISLATSLAFQGTQVLRKTLLDAFIRTEVCVFYSLPSILATRRKQAGEMGSLQRVWNPLAPSIWVAFSIQRSGGTKHVIRQGLLLGGNVQITHLGPSNSPPPSTRAPRTPRLQTENSFGVTLRKHSKDQCASDLSWLKDSLEMGRGDAERNVRKIVFSCTFNSPALSSEQAAEQI